MAASIAERDPNRNPSPDPSPGCGPLGHQAYAVFPTAGMRGRNQPYFLYEAPLLFTE